MKKNIKKFIPMVAIATLMTTSVFANNLIAQKPVLEQNDIKENQIYINGELLENAQVIKQHNKNLLPVRMVFEKLGYEIGYEPQSKVVTMTKIPHYITFSNTKDAYTFSRMAPQPLGHAPIVKDGVTYVPVELLDLIGIEYELNDKNILNIGEKLNNSEDAVLQELVQQASQNLKKYITITDIDEERDTITVDDPQKGTITLNIKDLKIDFTTDDKELMIDQALEVEYGDTMTASQPPMNTPKSIKVIQKVSFGEVLSVEKDEQNNTRILFKDIEKGEIVLILAPDFKIDYTTEDKELKKGQNLEVVLDEAMTFSLPPINNPKSVKVVNKMEENQTAENENKDEQNVLKGNATIKSVDKENKQILVKDEKMGEIVLNLNDDLKVEYKNAKKDSNLTYAYNWMVEGQKLEIEYSPIMTRSLPPINNPVKIIILN